MGARVTIRDVARAAQVSATTVSDSLRGTGRLSEETRQRVLETAHRMGYWASPSARNLRSGRTGILLMVIATPGADTGAGWNIEFFLRVMSAASEAAAERGFAVAMAPMRPSATYRFPCDGAVILDPVRDNYFVDKAVVDRLPLVTIGRCAGVAGGYVDNDFDVAVQGVMEHLVAQGAQRPAILTNSVAVSYVEDTVSAYTRWCARVGMTPVVQVAQGELSVDLGRRAAEEVLAGTDPPDALVCTLDLLAQGAVLAAESARLTVGRDVLIASLTDSIAIAGAAPPISAVDLAPDRIGATAVSLLMDTIERGEPPRSVVVPTHFHARASTVRR